MANETMADDTMADDTMANDTTADETTANDTMAKRFKYRANLKPNCFFEAFRKNPARFLNRFLINGIRLGIKWRWPNAKLTFMPIFAMTRKRAEGDRVKHHDYHHNANMRFPYFGESCFHNALKVHQFTRHNNQLQQAGLRLK
ncbi:hypothetical protein [Bacteroides caecimuris]|uniref:hypothetical protein n=1 Tax=Bacteroides caecimuris TaxID=1796613 RepID=UPI0025A262B8|nr:hypothetical protein [Bacteroides caecimuris]